MNRQSSVLAFLAAQVFALLFLSLISPIVFSMTPDQTRVSRHPQETKALVEPEQVLKELPALLQRASADKNYREVALLRLAESNACRVIADWSCQSSAGASARIAAEAADLPELQIRALIAESRGRMPMQDFTRNERLLGEAVLLLKLHPNPELSADVYLAYSSLSYTLGKHALAADYAARGLVALSETPSLLIRTRLLRNQARAMAQLGDVTQAQIVLKKALLLTEQVQDPKLSAELYMEDARIARLKNDHPTQIANGNKILTLSKQLKNLQLEGLGQEVLGLAAMNQLDNARAETHLSKANSAFRQLKLDRDERRVLRALLESMMDRGRPLSELEPLTVRLIELERSLETYDRTQATDDFQARLKYVQQEFDVEKLKVAAELAAQREKNLEIRQRFTGIFAVLSLLLLAVAIGFYLWQRQFNDRLQHINEQLRLSESRMRAITNNIPALISHIDTEERYLFSNSLSGRVFGIDPAAMIGKAIREVRGEPLYSDIKIYVESALRGDSVSFEGKNDIDGRLYHYQTNYVPDRDAGGNVQGFFALTFDITDLKLAEAALERLSLIDSMTEVANRRHFEERLVAALARSDRQQEAIALLYLDIDHLKEINDNNGHAAGDAVIMAFAQRLQLCVRTEDLVARLGGDEFAVLIENPRPESGETVAKKLRAAMQQPIIIDGTKIHVSTSIGVAYCANTPTAKELMSLADKALYAAKSAGRANYQIVVGE